MLRRASRISSATCRPRVSLMSMAVGRDLEDLVAVLEAEDVLVGPVAQAAVLGQAVAADAGAGEDDVAVGRAHLDGLDDLDEVDAVALGEEAPLVEEGQDGGAVGVLDDLGGLATRSGRSMTVSGNSSVLRTSRRNFSTRSRASSLQPAQTRQKSRMLAHVVAARHDALEAVGQQRRRASMPRAAKAFLRIGQATNSVVPGATVVSISTRQFGGIFSPMVRMVASRAAMSASPVRMLPRSLLEVVALDVDDDAVGELEAVAVVGGDEGLLLEHAAARSSGRPRGPRP